MVPTKCINPCLFVKKSEKDIVYVASYIDDNLMIGDIEAVNEAIPALNLVKKFGNHVKNI